jgi:hypothetical protein
MLKAYFAASATLKHQPTMAVGGFIYTEAAAHLLNANLAELYGAYEIPWYQVSRCEAQESPFDRLNSNFRHELRVKVGDLAIKYATCAISAAVPREAYKNTVGRARTDVSDYQFCVFSCLGGVRNWALENEYQAGIQYFFEEGAEHQIDTDRYFNWILEHPSNREFHFYHAHSLEPKTNRVINTANLFAWEAANTLEGLLIGQNAKEEYVRYINRKTCESKCYFENHLAALAPMIQLHLPVFSRN